MVHPLLHTRCFRPPPPSPCGDVAVIASSISGEARAFARLGLTFIYLFFYLFLRTLRSLRSLKSLKSLTPATIPCQKTSFSAIRGAHISRPFVSRASPI